MLTAVCLSKELDQHYHIIASTKHCKELTSDKKCTDVYRTPTSSFLRNCTQPVKGRVWEEGLLNVSEHNLHSSICSSRKKKYI